MSESYMGEIAYFPYSFAPVNWMTCSGQLLPVSQYTALFNLIGTLYGGDGTSTFALPDLQGRVPFGTGALDNAGPNSIIGTRVGTESVALTADQLPVHAHSMRASTVTATATDPTDRVFAANEANAFYAPSGSTSAMAAGAIGAAGSTSPSAHENRAPTLAMTLCICVQGIYPSRA